MGRGLPGQMLAAAEADLEPDILDVSVEQLPRIVERPGFGADSGQNRLDQPRLTGAQRRSLAPAVELAPPLRMVAGGLQASARRSSSDRSTRSQENPPSASGGRPKWP